MKRTFLILVVVIASALFYSHYQIKRDITEGLDQIATQLSPIGELGYGDVALHPSGSVEIANITFQPHRSPDNITVERIKLDTGNPWVLFRLGGQLREKQIPDHMQLAVQGVALDIDNEYLELLAKASRGDNPFARFEAAGCGERDHFDAGDLAAMGYSTLVWDTSLGYRVTDAGTRFAIEGEFETRGQAAVTFKVVFDNDMSLDNVGATPAFARSSRLSFASLEVKDRGYLRRVADFCARQTGVSPAEFREQHLTAWRQNWQALTIDPGTTVMDAYRDYLEQPGNTLLLEIAPFPRLDLTENYLSTDPVYLSQRLNPKIGTANLPLQAVAMAKAEAVTGDDSREASRGSASDAVAVTRNTVAVTATALARHLQKDVSLNLVGGRTMKGRILRVDGQRIQLRQYVHGGNMDIPVELSQIRSIRLM